MIDFTTFCCPPVFWVSALAKRRSPRREGYLSEIDHKKSGIENRAACKVRSVLSGTLLRPRICLSVVVCHDPPRDPSGDFLAQSWCALSFGEFRSGEIVPRDGMSCGEFENGVRPRRRRNACCYERNENTKKLFWKVASGE